MHAFNTIIRLTVKQTQSGDTSKGTTLGVEMYLNNVRFAMPLCYVSDVHYYCVIKLILLLFTCLIDLK